MYLVLFDRNTNFLMYSPYNIKIYIKTSTFHWVIKSLRGCLLGVGCVWFYSVRQPQVRLSPGERCGVCKARGFRHRGRWPWVSFGRKRKGERKEGEKCEAFSLCAGLLAAVTSKSAALIAPHRSRAGRDLSYLLSSRPTQPGVPSGEPRGRMSRERQGKAALAGG